MTHRIGSDEQVTEHEVIVIGMVAETAFNLQAVSVDAAGEEHRSAVLPFTTGALPINVYEGNVDSLNLAESQGGWTLFNASLGPNLFTPLVIQMVDIQGRTIWYYAPEGTSARLDTQVTWVDGAVLFGPGVAEGERIFKVDLAGRVVWEGPLQEGTTFEDKTLHHISEDVGDGGLLTVQFSAESVGEKQILSDIIREQTADLDVVWSWDAFDHTDQLPLDPDAVLTSGDWLHINAAAMDSEGDAVYFSSWTLQQVFKIERATGRIGWVLGSGGDFASDPTAERPWFGVLHAIEYLGDNRFILYDNSNGDLRSSRAVIYTVDDINMKVTEDWSYDGGRRNKWFNPIGGDADLLENDNVLIVGGGTQPGSSSTRIMEVSAGGQLVWRYFPVGASGGAINVFQADRIPALAQSLEP